MRCCRCCSCRVFGACVRILNVRSLVAIIWPSHSRRRRPRLWIKSVTNYNREHLWMRAVQYRITLATFNALRIATSCSISFNKSELWKVVVATMSWSSSTTTSTRCFWFSFFSFSNLFFDYSANVAMRSDTLNLCHWRVHCQSGWAPVNLQNRILFCYVDCVTEYIRSVAVFIVKTKWNELKANNCTDGSQIPNCVVEKVGKKWIRIWL